MLACKCILNSEIEDNYFLLLHQVSVLQFWQKATGTYSIKHRKRKITDAVKGGQGGPCGVSGTSASSERLEDPD